MKKILRPMYLKEFKCIGRNCEDNCCKHWKIFVDKDSYTKYQKLPLSEVKNQIVSGMKKNELNNSKEAYSTMQLKDNGSCVMLDSEELCLIQKELGHGYLCRTCRVYPRHLININGIIETSLMLSCPEAARVVLANKELMEFEYTEDIVSEKKISILNTEKSKNTCVQLFWEIRDFVIQVLQCRDYTINERLLIVATVCNRLDQAKTKDEILNILEGLIIEIQDGIFKNRLEKFSKTSDIQYKLLYQWLEFQYSVNTNHVYGEVLDNIKATLGTEEELVTARVEKYARLVEELLCPAMKQYEYIFEQYWVNTIFTEAFPLGRKTIMENFISMLIRYSIMKMHIVGIGAFEKKLDEENIIRAIQVYSKAFEHNKNLLDKMLEDFKEQNKLSLAYAAVLIK